MSPKFYSKQKLVAYKLNTNKIGILFCLLSVLGGQRERFSEMLNKYRNAKSQQYTN